jgi:hypothetical protein
VLSGNQLQEARGKGLSDSILAFNPRETNGWYLGQHAYSARLSVNSFEQDTH